MLGLLLGAALLGAFDDDPSYDSYDEDFMDESLKPCTDVWRSLHPFGYNQYTGGWTEEEDKENGW